LTPHLYQLLQERARRYPNAIAFGGQQGIGWRTLNSVELLRNVDVLAAELAAKGVSQGDRVVLWLPNQPRTPTYLFAVWRLGAVPVPFDREMNPSAGARIVASVQARCVITGYDERPAWAGEAVVHDLRRVALEDPELLLEDVGVITRMKGVAVTQHKKNRSW